MGASKVGAGTGLTFRDKRAATSAPSSFDRALTWPRLQQMLAEAFSPRLVHDRARPCLSTLSFECSLTLAFSSSSDTTPRPCRCSTRL